VKACGTMRPASLVGFDSWMHRRSALQSTCSSRASSRCVENTTAMATSRAQGRDPKARVGKSITIPIFNSYEQQLLQTNQSLVAARDRLDQARSLARVATSGLFPQLSADPSAVRERGSGKSSVEWRDASRGRRCGECNSDVSPIHAERFLRYRSTSTMRVDVFGRVRRNVEAANATLQFHGG